MADNTPPAEATSGGNDEEKTNENNNNEEQLPMSSVQQTHTGSFETADLLQSSEDNNDDEHVSSATAIQQAHTSSFDTAEMLQSSETTGLLTTTADMTTTTADETKQETTNERSESLTMSSERTINFLKDDPSQMTFSRRIALYLMKRYKWYNPRLNEASRSIRDLNSDDDDDAKKGAVTVDTSSRSMMEYDDEKIITKEYPSLERAWAYFEHVVLPRYVYKPDEKESMDRAGPGENKLETRLYHPLLTPQKQLGDWGLGIGLYFATLRGVFFLVLIAGLINIPNLLYFSGPTYSQGQVGVKLQFKGSAICTNQTWVPCPECDPADYPHDRIAVAITDDYNPNINRTFVKKNHCHGTTYVTGFINYGTLFFIIVGKLLLNRYLEKMAVEFDEDEQTAQDYSIVIENPPKDATDPEEWKQYIVENFPRVHVTVCTVAVGNELLLNYLVERREALNGLKLQLDPGTSLDAITLAGIAAEVERDRSFFQTLVNKLSPGIPELFAKLVLCESKISGLAQLENPATHVFMTFETENCQRDVLSKLTCGEIAAYTNNKSALENEKYLFRGEHVLCVKEAEEPDTINWKDLNWPFFTRIKRRAIMAVLSMASILGGAYTVYLFNGVSKYYAVYTIAFLNAIFPTLATFMTRLELYPYKSSELMSLYIKLAGFRWINTAIAFSIVDPFVHSVTYLDDALIPSVGALFWAEIFVTNLIQLANIPGQIKRNVLAPRAPTQDAMNSNMKGQEFPLADCYTNMTKNMFLAQFYSALFPASFLICALALFLSFFVQKQALTRSWVAPKFGAAISKVNRQFFLLTSIIMGFVSAYYWSGFPFDNLCEIEGSVVDPWYLPPGGDGKKQWSVQPFETDSSPENGIVVNRSDPYYERCVQNFLKPGYLRFPFISANQGEYKWMTDEQEVVTDVYGWTVVAVLAGFALSIIWFGRKFVSEKFRGNYEPVGESQGISFSDVPSITTYVPQVESSAFSYPLLAVDVQNIDTNLIEWTDPDRPYSFYDLTRDAENLLRGQKHCSKAAVFSRIAYWPPPPDFASSTFSFTTTKEIDNTTTTSSIAGGDDHDE